MKRVSGKAAIFAYLGVVLLMTGFYPGIDLWADRYPLVHSLWHLWIFTGAAALIYGLETLRNMARRHRRMIS